MVLSFTVSGSENNVKGPHIESKKNGARVRAMVREMSIADFQ